MPRACHRYWNARKLSSFAHFWQGAESLAPATLFRHLNFQKCFGNGACCTFWLRYMCFTPQRRALFRHLNFQKCFGNGACCTFWLRYMCFAPQRRALFRHLNFQKCSENGVFCRCWLRNVLRATTACKFSFLIWPDGSAPAALESVFFDPPSHKSWEKQIESRLFYLFAHMHLLPSDSFSSLILFLLLFFSLTLPTSAFPSAHIVRSLTSKLPSIILYHFGHPSFDDLDLLIELLRSCNERRSPLSLRLSLRLSLPWRRRLLRLRIEAPKENVMWEVGIQCWWYNTHQAGDTMMGKGKEWDILRQFQT